MTDDIKPSDKKPNNIHALFKGVPLPSEELQVNPYLVATLEELTVEAKKGEIQFMAYVIAGENKNIGVNMTGATRQTLAVAQGLRELDSGWQDVLFDLKYGDEMDD